MAKYVTSSMLAVLVLGTIAVFSTTMWENHWIVRGLFEPATEALVLGQPVLCIRVVAVWTSPREESKEFLSLASSSLKFLPVIRVGFIFLSGGLFLLFFLVLDVLLQRFVKLLDPALDTTQMERLTALFAVPEGRSLIDGVLANDTLLGALGKTFDEEHALVREVLKLVQEVFVVVFEGLVLETTVLLLLVELNLFFALDLVGVHVSKILA